MKAIIPMSIAVVLYALFSYETAPIPPSTNSQGHSIEKINELKSISPIGLEFSIKNAEVNTKYSEFCSGTFRNKLIVVSSKKIGGLGNGLDEHTNEPFTELFCMDLDENGEASNPLLFSRILNTKHNEGQVTFSPTENTIYFTRSTRENSKNYQLYKADLQPNSHGNWINIKQLTKNSYYSIENPHVSADGKKLYFASNKGGGMGGFDIYVSDIKIDGSLSQPRNLGPVVNTELDEKYPHLTEDGTQLFFASKGHAGLGGYDLFMSYVYDEQFDEPLNLGPQVNSRYNEVALTFIEGDKGYFSSNKIGGVGSYDLYKFEANPIEQTLQGIVVANETNVPLPETKVILTDAKGNVIDSQVTGIDAAFSFKLRAFQDYRLIIEKPGYEDNQIDFKADNERNLVYKEVLKLNEKGVAAKKK